MTAAIVEAFIAVSPRGHRIPSTIRPTADEAWRELRASISEPDSFARSRLAHSPARMHGAGAGGVTRRSAMMRQVELYTRDNGYVTTVLIPSMTPLLEGIRWGERMFMRGMDYVYREGVIWVVRGRSTRCPKERSRASRPNEFSSEVHESVLGPELRISN